MKPNDIRITVLRAIKAVLDTNDNDANAIMAHNDGNKDPEPKLINLISALVKLNDP